MATADARLKAILGIASKRELFGAGAPAWVRLRSEFGEFQTMPDAVRAQRYPGYGREMREGV